MMSYERYISARVKEDIYESEKHKAGDSGLQQFFRVYQKWTVTGRKDIWKRENIVGLVIYLAVASVMIGIGISQLRSKKPVAFYSGEKPPGEEELSDVKAWNQKHGIKSMDGCDALT